MSSFFKMREKPQLLRVTKSLAREVATLPACPSDRPRREALIDFLKSKIKAGEFRNAEWADCLVRETESVYRANGKHTSNSFVELFDEGYEPNGEVVLRTKYVVDTMEDLAKLYSSFDNKRSARKSDEIWHVYAQSNDTLSQMSSRVIGAAARGIGVYSFASPDERLDDVLGQKLIEHTDFVVWFSQIYEAGPDKTIKNALKRSEVSAAMFGTFKKAPQKATEFWSLVRDGGGANPKSPERMLNKFLRENAPNRGRGAASHKNKVQGIEFYHKSISAWNSWRDGIEEINFLRYENRHQRPAIK